MKTKTDITEAFTKFTKFEKDQLTMECMATGYNDELFGHRYAQKIKRDYPEMMKRVYKDGDFSVFIILDDVFMFCAELDGKIVCTSTVSTHLLSPISTLCNSLVTVFVEPEYRNRKIASTVLQITKDLTIKYNNLNPISIQANIFQSNKASIHLFESLGYIKTDESAYDPLRNDTTTVYKLDLKK